MIYPLFKWLAGAHPALLKDGNDICGPNSRPVEEMEEKYLQGDYKGGKDSHKKKIKPVIDNMGIISLKEPILGKLKKKGMQELNDEAIPYLLKSYKTTISVSVDSLKKEWKV